VREVVVEDLEQSTAIARRDLGAVNDDCVVAEVFAVDLDLAPRPYRA
jgi:hypothetical protein